MKVDAIILARGGSKGIPNKNLKNFCGKPLIEWTILQAKKSKRIRNIFLSSDSRDILSVGLKHNIKLIERPKKFSTDKATSESAVVKGLLKILQIAFNNSEKNSIINFINSFDDCNSLFEWLNIGPSISSQRQNGFIGSLEHIKRELNNA